VPEALDARAAKQDRGTMRLSTLWSNLGFLFVGCSGSTDPRWAASGAGGGIIATRDAAPGIMVPPAADFIKTEAGGYKLGPAIGPGFADAGVTLPSGCGIIVGVVRDFKKANEAGGHPDFEAYDYAFGPTRGLVLPTLGADTKPVYGSRCNTPNPDPGTCPAGPQLASKADFDEWYRNTPGVNQSYLLFVMVAPSGPVVTFDSELFFPLDGTGWGNSGQGEDGKQHNFGFTTEVHTTFQYSGGEKFGFTGDDDLWVFLNGKLAIDLGGVHPALNGTVDLDASAAELGIFKGGTYALDLFHAERHTTASHFRIDTTLTLVDCGILPPDVR